MLINSTVLTQSTEDEEETKQFMMKDCNNNFSNKR